MTPEELRSPLGVKVLAMMERIFGGAYNHSTLREVDWSDPRCIEIRWPNELATYDFDHLTRLVIACHDEAIRLEISPRSNRYLTLLFHQRSHDGKRVFDHHPTIEAAIAKERRQS